MNRRQQSWDCGGAIGLGPATASRLAILAAIAVLSQSPAGGRAAETRPVPHDAAFLKREQRTPLAPAPRILDVKHSILHYDKGTYCGHPRMVAFEYFGGGEIVVGHFHAPCKYEEYADVRHVNYQSRAVCLLQRSTDGGKTWPRENDVVVYDRTISAEQETTFLNQSDAARERYDMFQPGSMFFSQNTTELRDTSCCFFLRSPDKGRTWEKVPTVLTHPRGNKFLLHRHDTPVIRMPDHRTLLAAFQMCDPDRQARTEGDPAVFSSTDNGLSWQFLSRPVSDLSGTGVFAYTTLLLLPDGELQCYFLHIDRKSEVVEGLHCAISMCASKDGGKTWGDAVPIVGKGGGCWENAGSEGVVYRSPWPIRLKDGRILVLFARRRMPGGIGGVISSDKGRTWSEEFVLREDGKWWDLGYPVGCQLEDSRIFTAYYFNMQDGNGQGGTRYIAATSFRLEP